MIDEQVSVRSITGVDLTFSVAGPGSRSYAFVIDWHIRLLMGAAWLFVSAVPFNLSLKSSSKEVLLTWVPALALYLLYHPILEIVLRGRTPGKRMAGIRILGRDGGVPSTMSLFIRNIFRLIDSLPVCYAIGLGTCILTANRVRIGDMAAGTLVIIDESAAEQSLARLEAVAGHTMLSLESLELVDQVLERWDQMQPEKRVAIARSLLTRIDSSPDSIPAAALDESQLRQRLQSFLSARSSSSV